MRTDTRFKRCYNELLRHFTTSADGRYLLSERDLAARVGVSRTTLRKGLLALVEAGILTADHKPGRQPEPQDFFPDAETTAASVLVEQEFLKWILQSDSRPGQAINTARLAREFGTSTTTIREFLQSFQHFGLLERQSGGGWVFRGITLEFANELSDIREIFELRSVLKFANNPPEASCWAELRRIREEHLELLQMIEQDYHRFSHLDEKLHRLINTASANRFVTEFHQVISLIFHYHYQWNKRDERVRNELAIYQHLAYIDAILDRDEAKIVQTCTQHLQAARRTLAQSLM